MIVGVIVGSTGAASDCQKRAAAARPAASTAHAGQVLMPAHSCTLVTYHHRGDVRERNVCAPQLDRKHPRRFPPYPKVAHGRRDQVRHVRYPAEWVKAGTQADAEAARKAAASGAWG